MERRKEPVELRQAPATPRCSGEPPPPSPAGPAASSPSSSLLPHLSLFSPCRPQSPWTWPSSAELATAAAYAPPATSPTGSGHPGHDAADPGPSRHSSRSTSTLLLLLGVSSTGSGHPGHDAADPGPSRHNSRSTSTLLLGVSSITAGFVRKRGRLCGSVRAQRVKADTEMKGVSAIPAVVIIPSLLFLLRVKVIFFLLWGLCCFKNCR